MEMKPVRQYASGAQNSRKTYRVRMRISAVGYRASQPPSQAYMNPVT